MNSPGGLHRLDHIFVLFLNLAILISCGGGSSSNNGKTDPPQHALAVADTGSHRVLLYDLPLSTGQNASVVLGQRDFTTSAQTLSASGMFSPVAAASDSAGNIYVVDRGANRIVQFKPPFANGMAASLVIGQPDFVSNTANVSQNGLFTPVALAFDSNGNLWVSDSCRVLEYQPPFTTHMDASLVIGEPDFTSCTFAPPTSSNLNGAGGLAFDPSGSLWVADQANHRVLRFQPPFSNGMSANLVIGQSDFVHNGSATTASGLAFPTSVALDTSGNLYVADTVNNRVLFYRAPLSTGMDAFMVFGQTDFSSGASSTTQNGFTGPVGIALDSQEHLWVADFMNSRTLEFVTPFSNGMNAALVLGQTNFNSANKATTAAGENNPVGVATLPVTLN